MDSAHSGPKLRLAYLGSANWDLIARDFPPRSQRLLGQAAEIAPIPFGQYRSLLWDEGSILRREPWDVWVFCERIEDLVDDVFMLDQPEVQQATAERISHYIETITAARALVRGLFLLLDLSPVRAVSTQLEDSTYAGDGVRAFVHRQNQRLLAAIATVPDCHLLRLTTLIEQIGVRQADPGKYWHFGRMPFSATLGSAINETILATLMALRGRTVRLLITDLDNTLWGGLIGEDGLKGIRLGSDFPGNVHLDLQRFLRALKVHGVALALCSRNTESIALDAIARHPEMLLRIEDFVARRINWGDKADNIRAMAAEIGVGLASVCFLDDSPYERDLVRRALPEVLVPELPQDTSEWVAWLVRSPFFVQVRLTAEDRGRAGRYQIRARVLQEAAGFANRSDYWRSLGMKLFFHRLSDQNLQRVLQLLAKTNQFNLSNRRHQETDLRRLEREGALIFAIGLADKLSEHELIGCVIIRLPADHSRPAEIESLVLSCRVLGRDVESAVLGWVCTVTRRSGYHQILGRLVRTERNQPAQALYPDHGFTPDGDDFVLAIEERPVAIPDYFTIQES